jgi:hypothetical protein
MDSTWTFQWVDSLKAGKLWADLARLQSTKGGSRETELKLLAVIPTGSPVDDLVVIIVTPVVYAPRACLRALGSIWAVLLFIGILSVIKLVSPSFRTSNYGVIVCLDDDTNYST